MMVMKRTCFSQPMLINVMSFHEFRLSAIGIANNHTLQSVNVLDPAYSRDKLAAILEHLSC